MEKIIYARILKNFVKELRPKIHSSGSMNSTGFEQISRLSYGNNKIFLKLKDLAGKSLSEDNPFTYLVMAYIYYIDCEFERSMELFNKFLETNKEDLEATLGLAFCYRQLGDDKKFEKILTPI